MQNPADFVNADFPTPEAVAAVAMNPRFAQGMAIVPQARLCDFALRPYHLPVPINPADPSALCTLDGGWVSDIKPEMNTTDDIHHACDFRLYEFPGIGAFNTLKNLIHISTQYYFLEPTGPRLVLEVPVAYFMFSIPDRTLLDSGNYWDIKGHGLTQIVNDLGFENDFTIPADANIIESARAMLMADYLSPQDGGRQPANGCGAVGGECSGCPEPDGYGTGNGYTSQGYGVNDPNAQTLPYGFSTVLRQRGADGFGSTPLLYNATIGMKIESTSGAPIDPFNCKPMGVQTVTPSTIYSMVPGEMSPGTMVPGEGDTPSASFSAFVLSKLDLAGNEMYFDTSTGRCYDSVTGDEVDPITGAVGTALSVVLFRIAIPGSCSAGGGDGGPGVAQSNGGGYSPAFGWSVNDTQHAMTQQSAPGSSTYLHWVPEATSTVSYLYTAGTTGLKIDAVSGHPIDPWNLQPMAYVSDSPGYPSSSWAGQLFKSWEPYLSQTAYLDTSTLNFYTWDGIDSPGHLTQVYPEWNGVTPTPPQTVFQQAGGNGNVADFPPGAVGPQIGPIGAYTWPDPNNPGLTPSCCPSAGPNIPAYRIVADPSSQVVIDPDSGRHIAGDPKTTDTLPFTPKDNYLKSLNNLINGANYWPLYNTSKGGFRMSPLPYVDGTVPEPDPYFFYLTGPEGVIGAGASQKLLDQTAIANKVVVRSENTKRAAITAVGYNRSNGSYISVQNLGRIIQKQPAIQLDSITDQGVLQLRADVEANLAALPAETIQMEVMLNPFLEVHDVIGLNVYSPDGKTLEISTNKNPFLVSAWSHDFKTRKTTITLSRLVPL